MSDPISLVLPNGVQMDELITAGYAIAGALGGEASGAIKNFESAQMHTRLGTLPRYIRPGDLVPVNKESGIYTTVTGNVTAASVNEETFLAAVQSAETHAYEFLFDGAAWRFNGETAELAQYGVSITGTPAEGDAVVVHVQADTVYFESVDFDHDVPANPNLTHCWSLLSRDVLIYGSVPQSSPQALKAIAADEFPDGIAAGTPLHLTLDHGCYDGTTKQDGSYQMVTPVAVPVGGKIRHTAIGVYQGDAANYTKETILAGSWIFYDASYNEIGRSATTEGTGGTSLGTATAENKSYMVGSHLNSTRRQANGSNRGSHSAIKKWGNSDAAGAASGAIASWWYASDEFDMPVRSTLPGFLHGLDPAFVARLGKARKRTLLHPWDRTDGGVAYEDTEDLVWQPSMTELDYGNNNGVAECSPEADGTLRSSAAFALYQGASSADRIKRQNGTARYYFHRSPHPSSALNVRLTTPDGALDNSGANGASGGVAGLQIT